MAGIISAIIGGIVTTIFRGSFVAINGPANGLVVVGLAALGMLSDENGGGFTYVLAAFIIAGAIQLLMGLLRLGKLGDIFPPSVVQGLLAAIGIIIITKQIHVAVGVDFKSISTFSDILQIPESILNLNPFVTAIGVLSLAVLIIHPRIPNKFFHFVPAPLWVILIALPLVYLFNFYDDHYRDLLGFQYHLGPKYLIQIPDNLADSLMFPDFSKIGQPEFWLVVIMITLVCTIESIVSDKAVEKIDPYKRKTWLNRDLIGIGVSTIVSGFLGGLPVTTVVARSSVNVNHGAKTRWSNFFHGFCLLLIVFFFSSVIQKVPLAALAAILVFTGYKLTSPKVFLDAFRKGWEQFFILVVTITAVLLTGILWGVVLGIIFTLILHFFRSGLSLTIFGKYLVKPFSRIIIEKDGSYHVKVKGVANFANILYLSEKISKIPKNERVVMDFSHTRLIDYTVLEYVSDYAETYNRKDGEFDIIGLDTHQTSSHFPYALHIIESPQLRKIRLTSRQQKLQKLAISHGWPYDPKINWNVQEMGDFLFFDTRPIEFKKNIILGSYPDHGVDWEISDVTFDEGALLATDVYHTSIQSLKLPFEMPVFSLEKEAFLDKVLELAGFDDIDFKDFKTFSDKFVLKGPNEDEIRKFFTPELIKFFEEGDIYHLESNGNELLVFKYLRLATPKEILNMVRYSHKLVKRLLSQLEKVKTDSL